MAVTKISHKPFWDRVGKEARDMIKKIIFDKGKNVYGGKWLDGKYSEFPSKWVMINIKKQHREGSPREGYSYSQAKKGNMFKRQSSTKIAPVLTGDLVNDLGSYVKANPNGFETGFPTRGNIVEGLRKRFGKKGTITSDDRPMPIAVLKYVAKEYHKHIKRNQTCTTRVHKIGKK